MPCGQLVIKKTVEGDITELTVVICEAAGAGWGERSIPRESCTDEGWGGAGGRRKWGRDWQVTASSEEMTAAAAPPVPLEHCTAGTGLVGGKW